MNLSRKNIWKNKLAYYSIKVDLIGLIIITIFDKWINSGMSLAQILLLQGIFGLLILLSEFPSGIIADIWSRKSVLFLGQIFLILGIITYYFMFSFVGFVFAEAFLSLGLSFKSGTDSAFAYDSYLEINSPKESDNIISRGQQVMLFGNIFMLSTGGLLNSVSSNIPFMIAVVGYMFSTSILIIAIEPKRSKSSSSKFIIKKSIGYLNHPIVLKVLLMLVFLQVVLRIAFWAYIPQLSLTNLDPAFFGFVLGGANLVAFLASVWAKENKDSKILFFLVPLGVLGLLLMMSNVLLVIMIAIAFHQISRGIIRVINTVYLNRIVGSEVRASIASLLSTIVSLFYFVFTVVIDILQLDQNSIIFINFIIGLGFLFGWIIMNYYPKNSSVSKNHVSPSLD